MTGAETFGVILVTGAAVILAWIAIIFSRLAIAASERAVEACDKAVEATENALKLANKELSCGHSIMFRDDGGVYSVDEQEGVTELRPCCAIAYAKTHGWKASSVHEDRKS